MIKIIPYDRAYNQEAVAIWNEVVEDGVAFPQDTPLKEEEGPAFFESQSFTGLAINDSYPANDNVKYRVVGLYILHPNNVGRCGHICNASYAVKRSERGHGIGELLVKDCLKEAKAHNYKILQFNAVVATNTVALNLYKKLGFIQLGVIKHGFRTQNNEYLDIIPHYIELK